jgi:hypothetical protein
MNYRCLRIVTIAAALWLALPALSHAEFRPLSLAELVEHSDVIVVGHVTQVESIKPVPWDGTWTATRKAVIEVEQHLKGQDISAAVEVLLRNRFHLRCNGVRAGSPIPLVSPTSCYHRPPFLSFDQL